MPYSVDLPSVSGAGRPGPRRFPVALVAVLVIVAAGFLVAWFLLRGGPRQAAPPVLSDEARVYIRSGSLKLSDVSMGARDNFARQTLVEITGKITNDGSRPLRLVEITCVFHDPSGRVVLRERVPIVSERMKGLMPGETKTFRLPFDTIPASWNQDLPDLVIAQIVFG